MLRLLFMLCLAASLASCAGSVVKPQLRTPTNISLAAKGWQEAANASQITPAPLKTDAYYLCHQASCGGFGFMARGHGPMGFSPQQAEQFRKIVADPKYSPEWIRTVLTQTMPFSLQRFQGKFLSVRRKRNGLDIMLSGQVAAPDGVLLHMLGRLQIEGVDGRIAVGAGPSAASASQRLASAEKLR